MIIKRISDRVGVSGKQVQTVIELIENGATIPFIARYRKEATGNLDEVQLSAIQGAHSDFQELIKRKESILKAVDEQGQLTPDLKSTIEATWDDKKLEDLYLPFKRKQQTKAAIARKAGYEGLAKIIMSQRTENIKNQAARFGKIEEALEGAGHIIAEWISENSSIRDMMRSLFARTAILTSKVVKGKKEEGHKFKDYFQFEGRLNRMPSHRLLAILRGESEGILRTKIDVNFDDAFRKVARYYIKRDSESAKYIESAVEDSLKRLILPSIRNEVLKDAKEKADEEAIQVFTRNAAELLLSPPLGAKRVMGIDPGFRTGCKVVCLDRQGDLKARDTIYPHPPQKRRQEAEMTLSELVKGNKIEAIAIGNGTAGKETYQWLRNYFRNEDLQIFLVNEDGASIYSASEIAREEFPNEDITVRGAVSIARRLLDPLAELVKIDPKSIGVGQYQHDVNQKKLKDSLEETVISCVNKVGINLNTASKHLLSYVSGLGPALAQNIVDYRSECGRFNDIAELKKVNRLGGKAFEQCAGFLRIRDGRNPLDNTGVHPESYVVARRMLKDSGIRLSEAGPMGSTLDQIKLENYISETVGLPTLTDIIEELKKPGLDPRSKAKEVEFEEGLESINDLQVGQKLTGVVTNLTKFGAFVDLGIKESALLHISQIVDRYISDPAEVLSINHEVEVKVLEIDLNRKRISVSMKS